MAVSFDTYEKGLTFTAVHKCSYSFTFYSFAFWRLVSLIVIVRIVNPTRAFARRHLVSSINITSFDKTDVFNLTESRS